MEIYKDLESKKFLNFIETDWENNTFLHYTGNMYGLGCVAFSKEAVDRINHLKQRQRNKGFIVLIPDQEWLDIYKLSFQPRARILMQHYWPGNVTMVMKDTEKYFENVSYRGSVAVRIPSSNFLKDFLYRIKKPVISTSVNISGEIPLVRLDDIMKQRSDWFDFAVLPPLIEDVPSLPSTIIDISTNNITFLREGSISFADIRMAYDHPLILFVCTGNVCRSPMAEYYARSQIIFRGLPYEVASAGFLDKEVRISPYS
ncbi:MAG: threonylcarbamoyl-AMP synthase, partial [Candidatus Cloacimonetes bacterium]|nr:threonylcarbamoyl-AMP synthase [Candidatus Cloacimonadota bacterium]